MLSNQNFDSYCGCLEIGTAVSTMDKKYTTLWATLVDQRSWISEGTIFKTESEKWLETEEFLVFCVGGRGPSRCRVAVLTPLC